MVLRRHWHRGWFEMLLSRLRCSYRRCRHRGRWCGRSCCRPHGQVVLLTWRMILSLGWRGCLRLVELEVLLMRWRRHGGRRIVPLRRAIRMIPDLGRRSRLLLRRCRIVNWCRLVRNLRRWCMLRRRGIAHSLPSLWWRLRLRWRRIELCLVRWRRSRRRRILAMLLLWLRSWGALCRAGRRRIIVARHDSATTSAQRFNNREILVTKTKMQMEKEKIKIKDETLKELSPG
jgi:hypothetical protein